MLLLIFASSCIMAQGEATKEQVLQSYKDELQSLSRGQYQGLTVQEFVSPRAKSSIVVQDSSISYKGDSLEWIPILKDVVTKRDSAGNPLYSKILSYNDVDDEWEDFDSSRYVNGAGIWEKLSCHWLKDAQMWSDTSFYSYWNDGGYWYFFIRSFDAQTGETASGIMAKTYFNSDSSYSLRYRWDTVSQAWLLKERDFYYFDALGNMTGMGQQNWDAYYQIWRNDWKQLYSYDSANRRVEFIMQTGVLQTWVNVSRQTFEYGEDDLLDWKIGYKWNDTEQNWDTLSTEAHTYDELQRPLSVIVKIWDENAGSLKNSEQVLYSYEGNEETQLTQIWNDSEAVWENEEWKHLVYNDAHYTLQELTKHWNFNQEWINYKQFTREYLADTLMSSSMEQTWDAASESWINNEKILLEYNENGRITHTLHLDWNFDTGVWENSTQYFNAYDSFGNISEKYHQYWNPDVGQWINSFKENDYYSEFSPSGVAEIYTRDLLIFPNPAHDFLQVSTKENVSVKRIRIFNEAGQEVLKKEYEGFSGGLLSIRSLYPGVYLIRVDFDRGKAVVRKFVKK